MHHLNMCFHLNKSKRVSEKQQRPVLRVLCTAVYFTLPDVWELDLCTSFGTKCISLIPYTKANTQHPGVVYYAENVDADLKIRRLNPHVRHVQR